MKGLATNLFIPTLAVVFLLLISTASAVFSGNDDGFHTSGTVSVSDGALTNVCTVDMEDHSSNGDNTNIGSFDDPDDTGTARTPIQLRITGDLGAVANSANCRVIIYPTQTCGSGTPIVDRTHTMSGTDINPQITEYNETTANFDGNTGELCIRLIALVSDGIGAAPTTTVDGKMAVTPYITTPTIGSQLIFNNMNQTVHHNLDANEASDITSLKLRLAKEDNTYIKTEGTDTTPSTKFVELMSSFSPSPTWNGNHKYIYQSWTDNGNTYTRFSTNSLSSSSGTNPKTGLFNISDGQPTIYSQDGNIEIRDNNDGYMTFYIEGVPVFNYTGYFVDGINALLPIIWYPIFTQTSMNYTGETATGNYNSWLIPTERTIKIGANYSGSSLTQTAVYQVLPYPDTTLVQDQNIAQRIYIKNPSLSDYYLLDYHDMPEGTNINPDGTGANKTFTLQTEWTIDPNLGGTEDGFDKGRTLAVTMGAQTHTVNMLFYDSQNFTSAANYGSYNDINDTATDRNPMSIAINSTVAVTIGTNTVRIQLHANESCSSTAVYDQTFTNNNDLLGQPNRFFVNLTAGNFTSIGEKCINMTVVANNGIGSGTGTDAGKIGLAPLITNATISNTTINFLENQTLTHGLESNDARNISYLSLDLRADGSTSGTGYYGAAKSTTNAYDPYVLWLINFSTNPTANTIIEPYYSRWADSSPIVEHVYFSTSSTGSSTQTEARTFPRGQSFNISNILNCTNFTIDDGRTLYNRGEVFNRSGTVRDVNGNKWFVVNSVTFDIQYRNSSGISNFTNTSFDISNGDWNRDTTIPTTATATHDYDGDPYSMYFQVDNDADATEFNSCIYSNTGNISRAYNETCAFDTSKYWIGNLFAASCQTKNARQEALASVSPTMRVFDSVPSQRYSQTSSTNSTGFISMTGNYVTKPTGTWYVNATITHNGNTEIATTGTTTVAEKAGEDPLTLDCENANTNTNDVLFCIAHQRDLDGLAITGSTISYNVTKAGANFASGTMQEISGGDYELNFTPTEANYYRVYINTTYSGSAYSFVEQFRIKDSSGGGGGGLDASQNATLYAIVPNITAARDSINTNVDSAETSINSNVDSAETNIINEVQDVVPNWFLYITSTGNTADYELVHGGSLANSSGGGSSNLTVEDIFNYNITTYDARTWRFKDLLDELYKWRWD